MTRANMTNITATQIIAAINAGLTAGGDDQVWDAPEFSDAVKLTGLAGCVWDFTGWHSAAEMLNPLAEGGSRLGGVRFGCGRLAPREENTMPYEVHDNNASEHFHTLADAIDAANNWHDYMVDEGRISREDLAECPEISGESVSAVYPSVRARLNAIAAKIGAKAFYGHGNYACDAASQSGLSLEISEKAANEVACVSEAAQ